ncbi:polysaccharide lyase [Aquimarina sp. M1]
MKNHLLCSMFLLLSIVSVKAQISGTIRDQSGNPIENALVCDANNVTNYTKTDENGVFDLTTGNSSTQLRIGALKYKTIKTTSQRNIVLAPDPLLENDEYHISFDHIRVGDTYTENELKKDFPTSNGIGFYDGQTVNGQKDDTQDRASIDYENSIDPDGVSLKVKYPKGLLKTNSSGIDTRIPLMNTFKDNYYESSDLYLSYWIKFSDDFDFNLCGGKLPSLGGSDPNTPDGERDRNRWKGRIMFRKGGAIQFYMELPGEQEPADDAANQDENELRFWGNRVVDGSDICSFEYENYLRAQGWHNIELHYVLEGSPSGSDGLFEGWVDGVNYDFVGSDYFNYYRNQSENRENITINHILISTFLGGSDIDDYAPKDTDYYVWFDEFRVAEQRINEWDFYMNPLSVEDHNDISNIKVFPNPSFGSFNLPKKINWKAYDLSGKEIANGSSKMVDLKGHPKGLYFLKMETSDIPLKLMIK